MSSALDMAEIAHLVGDVARANMLAALLDGRASTALELSLAARVTPQTASAHLAKLVDGRLLHVEKQGRHRYFRLASARVAQTLESIMALAADSAPCHRRPARMNPEMRRARTCYDHIAGEIGVALADGLVERGFVVIEGEAGEVTAPGRDWFAGIGVDLAPKSRRIFCRPCLDWSERRTHLGGLVGAAIATCCFDHGWMARRPGSRTLTITLAGRSMLPATFGAHLQTLCEPVHGAGRRPM
jgi:DNA-binding transcriptional ArsR family regulator